MLRFILASISGFLNNDPILTHSFPSGPNIFSKSCLVASKISVPGNGGIAGTIDCAFCSLSRKPKIIICDVYPLSLRLISAISLLSIASSKFFTSDNAMLDTKDLSTRPRIFLSSELIITYSPIDNGLEANTVTLVGFDSPMTYPIINLIPPLNQSLLIIHVG